MTKEYEYVSQTVSGKAQWFVSKVKEYPNENLTGAIVTQYAYTFFANTYTVEQKTTTLPAVSTGNNGNGVAATRVERFDKYGNLLWSKDELGIITYRQYDYALGVRVKTIVDVNTVKTSDFNTSVPSGCDSVRGLVENPGDGIRL